MIKKVTANDIVKLLETKHSKDICIPACKTGGSWVGDCLQIDFWAMKQSFSKPRSYAYEIKVTRQDFLRDDKWQKYLPYCSDFYFCAPQGIIEPNELPAEVGLTLCSKNFKRLYTKKKAVSRDIIIPEDLFKYILMWRAEVTTREPQQNRDSNIEYWKQWLKEKEETKALGRNVSIKIQQVVRERINAVEQKNRELEFKIDKLEFVKQFFIDLGLDEDNLNAHNYHLKSILKEQLNLKPQIPNDIKIAIKNAFNQLERANQLIQQ